MIVGSLRIRSIRSSESHGPNTLDERDVGIPLTSCSSAWQSVSMHIVARAAPRVATACDLDGALTVLARCASPIGAFLRSIDGQCHACAGRCLLVVTAACYLPSDHEVGL